MAFPGVASFDRGSVIRRGRSSCTGLACGVASSDGVRAAAIVGDEPISFAALLAAPCCSLAQVVMSTATRTILTSQAISVPSPARYQSSPCLKIASAGRREFVPAETRTTVRCSALFDSCQATAQGD